MNSEEFAKWEQRIAARALRLWEDAGRPDGSREAFTQNARELIAIEENPTSGTLDPEDAADPVVDEASLQANLGEFPSFSDTQAEEPSFPDPANEKPSDK